MGCGAVRGERPRGSVGVTVTPFGAVAHDDSGAVARDIEHPRRTGQPGTRGELERPDVLSFLNAGLPPAAGSPALPSLHPVKLPPPLGQPTREPYPPPTKPLTDGVAQATPAGRRVSSAKNVPSAGSATPVADVMTDTITSAILAGLSTVRSGSADGTKGADDTSVRTPQCVSIQPLASSVPSSSDAAPATGGGGPAGCHSPSAPSGPSPPISSAAARSVRGSSATVSVTSAPEASPTGSSPSRADAAQRRSGGGGSGSGGGFTSHRFTPLKNSSSSGAAASSGGGEQSMSAAVWEMFPAVAEPKTAFEASSDTGIEVSSDTGIRGYTKRLEKAGNHPITIKELKAWITTLRHATVLLQTEKERSSDWEIEGVLNDLQVLIPQLDGIVLRTYALQAYDEAQLCMVPYNQQGNQAALAAPAQHSDAVNKTLKMTMQVSCVRFFSVWESIKSEMMSPMRMAGVTDEIIEGQRWLTIYVPQRWSEGRKFLFAGSYVRMHQKNRRKRQPVVQMMIIDFTDSERSAKVPLHSLYSANIVPFHGTI